MRLNYRFKGPNSIGDKGDQLNLVGLQVDLRRPTDPSNEWWLSRDDCWLVSPRSQAELLHMEIDRIGMNMS